MKDERTGASLLWRMSKSSTYQQNNVTFDTDAPLKFFSLCYKFATKTFWVWYIRQCAGTPRGFLGFSWVNNAEI